MVSEKFTLDYKDIEHTAGWRDLSRVMMGEIAVYGKVLESSREGIRAKVELIRKHDAEVLAKLTEK